MNTRLFTLFVAAIVLTILPSCVEPPPGSESSIWQRPPRYGHGGTDSPRPSSRNNDSDRSNSSRDRDRPREEDRGSGSRFGYSGGDDDAPDNSRSSDDDADAMPSEASDDDKPEEKPEEKMAEEKPKEEKKSSSGGAPAVADMPFAKGVPGKPLSVTLPPPHSSLGEISIEQYEGGKPTGKPLPPGTPVEIPDPGNPGKKIYFKVP